MDQNIFNALLATMRQDLFQPQGEPTAEELAAKARAAALLDKISQTPGGDGLVRFLTDNGISFHWSRDVENAQYRYQTMPNEGAWWIVPGSRHIVLNPDLEDTALIIATLHEARHAQQASAKLFSPENDVSPLDAVLLNRFVEADAQAEAVLKTFKMKVAGDGAAFESGKQFGYAEMFAAAEEGYAQDPNSLNDGRLKRMIFDAWFTPVTKGLYDACIAGDIYPRRMAMLKLLPEHGLRRIPLNVEDIEKIGVCGGEKVNYMTLPGFKPLTDPLYLGGFTDKTLETMHMLDKEREMQPAPPEKKQQTSPGGP